jgi:hypothetical protein
MKVTTLFLLLLLSFETFSQTKVENLFGKWIEKSVNGSSPVECPYRIFFEKGKYKVLNVCYGADSSFPITEDGIWTFDAAKKVVVLKNRKAHDNNDLYVNSNSVLNIHIKEYMSNSITIYFDSEKNQAVFQKAE